MKAVPLGVAVAAGALDSVVGDVTSLQGKAPHLWFEAALGATGFLLERTGHLDSNTNYTMMCASVTMLGARLPDAITNKSLSAGYGDIAAAEQGGSTLPADDPGVALAPATAGGQVPGSLG